MSRPATASRALKRSWVRKKIEEVERELEQVASSHSSMGIYDIEHLENARILLADLRHECS